MPTIKNPLTVISGGADGSIGYLTTDGASSGSSASNQSNTASASIDDSKAISFFGDTSGYQTARIITREDSGQFSLGTETRLFSRYNTTSTCARNVIPLGNNSWALFFTVSAGYMFALRCTVQNDTISVSNSVRVDQAGSQQRMFLAKIDDGKVAVVANQGNNTYKDQLVAIVDFTGASDPVVETSVVTPLSGQFEISTCGAVLLADRYLVTEARQGIASGIARVNIYDVTDELRLVATLDRGVDWSNLPVGNLFAMSNTKVADVCCSSGISGSSVYGYRINELVFDGETLTYSQGDLIEDWEVGRVLATAGFNYVLHTNLLSEVNGKMLVSQSFYGPSPAWGSLEDGQFRIYFAPGARYITGTSDYAGGGDAFPMQIADNNIGAINCSFWFGSSPYVRAISFASE